MKVLVTGATGFVGTHLMELLQQDTEAEVIGTTAKESNQSHLRSLDLTNRERVQALLAQVQPDVIYHLAAFSSPAQSFKEPVVAITSTVTMEINLYEACLALEMRPRFLVVSSGQIYGRAESRDLPLNERHKLDFASPYAVGKVAQENLASFYSKRGIDSVIARPFNHIGPGQQLGFLLPDLAMQVAQLEKAATAGILRVGNLASRRDFTDVRDIVRAYILLAERGRAGQVYNVCTGKSVSGQEILDLLLGIAKKKIDTEPDPARMRPADIPDLYGDGQKLQQDTGWKPKIKLEATLHDTLNYWRSRV